MLTRPVTKNKEKKKEYKTDPQVIQILNPCIEE